MADFGAHAALLATEFPPTFARLFCAHTRLPGWQPAARPRTDAQTTAQPDENPGCENFPFAAKIDSSIPIRSTARPGAVGVVRGQATILARLKRV